MADERVADVLGCVQKLRQQRMLMVQTKDQFVFLHDAILEAINVGNKANPCSTLAEEFIEICEEQENEESELQKQFMLLCTLKQREEEQYKEGLLEENKDKNRDISVIPAEHDRPYLTMRGKFHDHYINAVFVDVTQMPLAKTQADLWRLVYDHQLNAIVMLNEMDESDETCKQYWPDEGSQVYGPIIVTHMATANISPKVIMREFVVNLAQNEHDDKKQSSSKPFNVRHYQLLGWPNSEVLPPDKGALLLLIEEVHRWRGQSKHSKDTKKTGHMVIHCLNGVTHSGLFCGVSHIVDNIKLDEEVDALSAARYVSRRRQQFYQTLDEYKFLYEIALEYITRNDHTYANCS
ncbi:hypothetical protein LSH36_456g04083 [Paralvinella palmiformis]|uniref:protein-tyrosine-phosphatase n=1 Tax=Paralvinella palmiformis TaxID=53620 RepID=A0AAD9JBR5_9ANNE|nr:hypothetical protein LSH36_456g04083 [Paralvinella palmiformis]